MTRPTFPPLFLLAGLFLSHSSGATERTFTFESDVCGEWEARYDAERITENEIRAALVFFSDYPLPGVAREVAGSENNFDSIRFWSAREKDAAEELRPLARYYRESLEFQALLGGRVLEYERKKNATLFAAPLAGIDPVRECADTVEAMRAGDLDSAQIQGWRNCVNRVFRSRLVEPDAWEAFTRARGIDMEMTGGGASCD